MGTPLSGAPWMTQLPQFKPGIFAGLLHAQQNQIMQENQRRGWQMDDLNQSSQRTQNELDALKLSESQKEATEVSPLARIDAAEEFKKKDRLRAQKEEEERAISKGKIETEQENKRRRDAVAHAEWLSRMDDDMGQDEGFMRNQEKYLKYAEEAKTLGINVPAYWSPETKDRIAKAAELARRNLPGMRAKLDQEERERVRDLEKLAVQGSTQAAVAGIKDEGATSRAELAARTSKENTERRATAALEALQFKLQNSNGGKPPKPGEVEARAMMIMSGQIPSTPEEVAQAEWVVKYMIDKAGVSATIKMAQDAAIAANAGVGNLVQPPASPSAVVAPKATPQAGKAAVTPTPSAPGSGPDSVPPMPTSLGPVPSEAGRIYAQPDNLLKDVTDLDHQLREAAKPGNKNPNQHKVLQEERQKALRQYLKSEGVIFNANGNPVDTPENKAKFAAAQKKYEAAKK